MVFYKLPKGKANQIAQALSNTNDPLQLKQIKNALFSTYLKGFHRKNRDISTFSELTKDVPFGIIPMKLNSNLIVVDGDDALACALIEAHLPTTLTHKTLKGKHYYYEAPSGADLAKLAPNETLHIDIFTPLSKERIIYEGASTNYYSYIDNGFTQPRLLTSEELAWLYEISALPKHKSAVMKLAPLKLKGKFFDDYRQRTDTAYALLERLRTDNNPPTDYELNSTLGVDINQLTEGSGRNNTLNRLLFKYGRAGYWKSPQDLKDFIARINSRFAAPLSDRELNVILRESSLNLFVYGDDAARQFVQALKISQENGVDNIPPIFIARKALVDKKTHPYLLIEYENKNNYSVRELSKEDIHTLERQTGYKEHFSRYFSNLPTRKKGETAWGLDDTKLPQVELHTQETAQTNLYEWDSRGILHIHTGYFFYNVDIDEFKKQGTLLTQDELWQEFTQIRAFQVLEKNLFPQRNVLIKFLGDLAHAIRNKTYSLHMCILKDSGDTGKDTILLGFLKAILLGPRNPNGSSLNNTLFSTSQTSSQATLTDLKSLAVGQFTSWGFSPLFCVHENGGAGAQEITLAFEKLKRVIKNPYLQIHEKHKREQTIPSHIFPIMFTNQPQLQLPEGDNTRYYMSLSDQKITLDEWRALFPTKQSEQLTAEEYAAAMRLLLFFDFKRAGYEGHDVLPPELDENDEISRLEYLLDGREVKNHDLACLKILNYFCDKSRKKIIVKRCQNIPTEMDDEGSNAWKLRPLADLLMARYGSNVDAPKRSRLTAELYKLGHKAGDGTYAFIKRVLGAPHRNARLRLEYTENAPLIYTEEEDF